MKKYKTNRLLELSFIEDVKILHIEKSLVEYYNKSNQGLFEFLNPDLSYDYEEKTMSDGQKMWIVKKQDKDPQFLVTLKNGGGGKYWVLDFYFYESGFEQQKGLEGKNYLDTLSKIVKDNIIPYFKQSDKRILYFNSYSGDGSGESRKKLFTKLLDKYLPKNDMNIEIRNEDFIITKK